jgi:hypothetical protein
MSQQWSIAGNLHLHLIRPASVAKDSTYVECWFVTCGVESCFGQRRPQFKCMTWETCLGSMLHCSAPLLLAYYGHTVERGSNLRPPSPLLLQGPPGGGALGGALHSRCFHSTSSNSGSCSSDAAAGTGAARDCQQQGESRPMNRKLAGRQPCRAAATLHCGASMAAPGALGI